MNRPTSTRLEASETTATPETADFLARAIGHFGPGARRVLDVGCGRGALVAQLIERGLDAWGCDFAAMLTADERLRAVSSSPYRLPFEDRRFDVVLSTSVLEHVRDKVPFFSEIHRVLVPGGVSIHLYPGKWYLPTEPHIGVPLANWLWPRRPRWWYALWARLGVRNTYQRGLSAAQTAASNLTYAQDSLSYWSTAAYRAISLEIFGDVAWPMDFFIAHSPGGVARLGRGLRMPGIVGAVSRETRMALMVQRKLASK